jgi:SNF2 family DNA or RNA helicase
MKLNFEKDIVFTTFATVASELIRGNSPLAKIHWFRIVLDEGKSRLSILVDNHFSSRAP